MRAQAHLPVHKAPDLWKTVERFLFFSSFFPPTPLSSRRSMVCCHCLHVVRLKKIIIHNRWRILTVFSPPSARVRRTRFEKDDAFLTMRPAWWLYLPCITHVRVGTDRQTAQRCSVRLVIERSWVRSPVGAAREFSSPFLCYLFCFCFLFFADSYFGIRSINSHADPPPPPTGHKKNSQQLSLHAVLALSHPAHGFWHAGTPVELQPQFNTASTVCNFCWQPSRTVEHSKVLRL